MNDNELTSEELPFFARRLALDSDADERAVKRAYARELKLIDQEADRAGFQQLREAYDEALFWARQGALQALEAEAAEAEPADPAKPAGPAEPAEAAEAEEVDELARAARELQLHPAPVRAPARPVFSGGDGTGAAPPAAETGPDAQTMAQQVFDSFVARCAGLDEAQGSAPWISELQASLADPWLVQIDARDGFEQRVADLLAAGWQPGHHVLLPAATAVFDWERDPRRLRALGAAGYVLHLALEQRALYAAQPSTEREQQRLVIARVRATAPPTTSELISMTPTLVWLEARYPAWLALIADAGNIARWHALEKNVSGWSRLVRRRDLMLGAIPVLGLVLVVLFVALGDKPAEGPAAQTYAEKLSEEGGQFLDNDQNEKAVERYDRAIKADPKLPAAYAGRAMALIYLSENERALADLKTLEALQPNNAGMFQARGLMAQNAGRHKEAVNHYTRSLEIFPSNIFPLMQRAQAYLDMRQYDRVLKDTESVLELDPGRPWAHLLRARVHKGRKDLAAARAEAAAVLASADKRGAVAHGVAAMIYYEIGDRNDAVAAMDQAIAASPAAAYYITRSKMRPASDFAQRRADLEAALKIEPGSPSGLATLLRLEMEAKQWATLVDTANRALKQESMKEERQFLMTARGIGHARQADMAAARADFDAARLEADKPVELNNLCYELALQGVELETALGYCNASLEQEPKAIHTLDSKAFTLLRLKRYGQARDVYDALLAVDAASAEALYGRGVARYRGGDRKGGQADMASARAINPDIDAYYAALNMAP